MNMQFNCPQCGAPGEVVYGQATYTCGTTQMNIDEAEKQIAKILAALESATGQHIQSIGLHDIDVTQIDSTRQILDRKVVIELKAIPGTRWNV